MAEILRDGLQCPACPEQTLELRVERGTGPDDTDTFYEFCTSCSHQREHHIVLEAD